MDKASVLYKLADAIKDERLRGLVYKYLDRVLGSASSVCVSFDEAPGEIEEHHSYPGGLLDHTISVTRISMYIADLFKEVYGFDINRDLVLACAILHDLYKVLEFKYDGVMIERCEQYYPHDARLSGEILANEGLVELAKCITELHGYYGYTSLESLVVGLSDILDAKFHSVIQSKIRNYLARRGRADIRSFYEFVRSKEWCKKGVIEEIMLTPP
jgi:7,8-dihydroneopterin 2',3'-cyclic phosphate phosphodiesterase